MRKVTLILSKADVLEENELSYEEFLPVFVELYSMPPRDYMVQGLKAELIDPVEQMSDEELAGKASFTINEDGEMEVLEKYTVNGNEIVMESESYKATVSFTVEGKDLLVTDVVVENGSTIVNKGMRFVRQ